jgi:hypothetical protein
MASERKYCLRISGMESKPVYTTPRPRRGFFVSSGPPAKHLIAFVIIFGDYWVQNSQIELHKSHGAKP